MFMLILEIIEIFWYWNSIVNTKHETSILLDMLGKSLKGKKGLKTSAVFK